jgi:hypothetical protein
VSLPLDVGQPGRDVGGVEGRNRSRVGSLRPKRDARDRIPAPSEPGRPLPQEESRIDVATVPEDDLLDVPDGADRSLIGCQALEPQSVSPRAGSAETSTRSGSARERTIASGFPRGYAATASA